MTVTVIAKLYHKMTFFSGECMQVDGQNGRIVTIKTEQPAKLDLFPSPLKQEDVTEELSTVNLTDLRNLGINFDSNMDREFALTDVAHVHNSALPTPQSGPLICLPCVPIVPPHDAVVVYSVESDIVENSPPDQSPATRPMTEVKAPDWSADSARDIQLVAATVNEKVCHENCASEAASDKRNVLDSHNFAELVYALSSPCLNSMGSELHDNSHRFENWDNCYSPHLS